MGVLDGPPDFATPQWQELLEVVSNRFYRSNDIERLLTEGGVPVASIVWSGTARFIWMDAFNVAWGSGTWTGLVARLRAEDRDVAERLDELGTDSPPVKANLPPDGSGVVVASFDGRERQIVEDDDTLLDVAFLEQGLAKAASVCRLTATFGPNRYHGSGFRVGPDRILTNHHVLFDWDAGDRAPDAVEAWFDYQNDVDGRPKTHHVVACDPSSAAGDKDHDWAVVTTTDPVPDRYPVIELDAPARPVALDDRVYIIQHPQGMRKKIGMHHNLVRHVDDDVLRYWTDTESGSSGSPVFNREWQLVGLHHYWVATPGDEHGFANQGRRIEPVMAGVAGLG